MGNSHSDYTIIRVTPTIVEDSAYADGDVLFTATEIPNAVRGDAGCSKLISAFMIDKRKQSFDCELYFCEANTAFGTIDETANISVANIEAAKVCCVLKKDDDQGENQDLDNIHINKIVGMDGSDDFGYPTLIQAAASSTSVFVTAVITNGTPTFTETDDIDIILHIQYR